MAVGDTSPAHNIGEILKAVVTPDIVSATWPMSIGNLPSSPDQCFAVLDVGGPRAEPGLAINYPTVQVLIRAAAGGPSYGIAYDKATEIFNALVGIPSRPTAWPALASCVPIGHITPIGQDKQNRELCSLNLQLIVTFDSVGHREVAP